MINNNYICSCNQERYLSRLTASTTIGINPCQTPHNSEHCKLSLQLFNVINIFFFVAIRPLATSR